MEKDSNEWFFIIGETLGWTVLLGLALMGVYFWLR